MKYTTILILIILNLSTQAQSMSKASYLGLWEGSVLNSKTKYLLQFGDSNLQIIKFITYKKDSIQDPFNANLLHIVITPIKSDTTWYSTIYKKFALGYNFYLTDSKSRVLMARFKPLNKNNESLKNAIFSVNFGNSKSTIFHLNKRF